MAGRGRAEAKVGGLKKIGSWRWVGGGGNVESMSDRRLVEGMNAWGMKGGGLKAGNDDQVLRVD